MKATVSAKHTFEIDRTGSGYVINGNERLLDVVRIAENRYHILFNGRSHNVQVIGLEGKRVVLDINGKRCEVSVATRLDEVLAKLGMEQKAGHFLDNLRAPMPGLVIDVRVEPGMTVAKGDSLVVLEAMKMENALKSHGDAKVKSVRVKKGDAVEKGQVLVEFE